MSGDKQAECGCHRACTTIPHPCTAPCKWPLCLTEDEAAELLRELEDDARNGLL